MKISLVVMTSGKSAGQTIPVTLTQFVIGRDPQCNLRPASAVISKRHCALLVKNGKVYIRDFDSTNGTFVNEEQLKGERQLNNDDILKIGPLEFRVVIESTTPVNKPTPIPAKTGGADDDSVAAMLLSLQEDGESPENMGGTVDIEDVPGGSTVMDMISVPGAEEAKPEDKKPEETKEPEAKKPEAKKPDNKVAQANTSAAAKAILEKYTRRTRN